MPKITIERETLERAIDALGPVGGSNARNAYAELRAALKGEPDMSDVMLFGVLKMPYEMAMGHELSRRQYWQRAQEAAERLERAEAELARALDALVYHQDQTRPIELTQIAIDAIRAALAAQPAPAAVPQDEKISAPRP